MELSDQVITLETAKKLKELGIKQESLFYWYDYFVNGWSAEYREIVPRCDDLLSAFTASELMDLIPARINILDSEEPFDNFRFNMFACHIGTHDATKFIKHYAINYHCDTLMGDEIFSYPRQLFEHNVLDQNFAECCAKVLIKLIEKGYVKL